MFFLPLFLPFAVALQCSTLCNKKKEEEVMLGYNDTTSNITGESTDIMYIGLFTQNSTVHTHVRGTFDTCWIINDFWLFV